MNVGIVGLGVVGSAVKHGLERIGHRVLGSDPKFASASEEEMLATDVVFVCVPTPQRADGSCDTSIVEGVVRQFESAFYSGIIVIKSTVRPGTTARLALEHKRARLAFCPEFLRERAAFVDFVENHDLCVIGTNDVAVYETIRELHGPLPRQFACMSTTEAELAKYFSNVLNALRVVFANEFFEVTRALGADYGVIKAAMVKRDTIPDVYLDCNDSFRGFGGVCLPKDSAAFAELARDVAPNMKLFEAIVEENRKFRVTVPEGMRA